MYVFKMYINHNDIALYFYCTGRSHNFTAPCGGSFCQVNFYSLSLEEVHLFVNQVVAIFPAPSSRTQFQVYTNNSRSLKRKIFLQI